MTYFLIFLAVATIMLIYMGYEAGSLKVERIRFTLSKKGLKIAQLSDIHIKFLRVSLYKVKKVIKEENPDIIIFTGDYIDRPYHINVFLDFIKQIKGNITTYLCMGNHDYGAFRPGDDITIQDFIHLLEGQGIRVLHNRALCYTKNQTKYNIIGIEDLSSGESDVHKALSSGSEQADVNIAFSHNPDIVFQIPKGKVDFLFCGHFHGGQIWMPFNLEFKLLRKEILCKMGITRGLHRVNGINLYINRGLGNACFPLRFLSRPEVTIFHLP